MHSSVCDSPTSGTGGLVDNGSQRTLNGADVLVAIAALVTEGRIPDTLGEQTSLRGYSEGPHCHQSKRSASHACDSDQFLCSRYERLRSHVLALLHKSIPLCIEVLLTSDCDCGRALACRLDISSAPKQAAAVAADAASATGITTQSSGNSLGSHTDTILLEQWYLTVGQKRSPDHTNFTTQQLLNAIRSQLHFSQLAAWFSTKPNTMTPASQNKHKNIIYRLTIPGETFEKSKFKITSNEHHFPTADIGDNRFLKVTMNTLPRLDTIPNLRCEKCESKMPRNMVKSQLKDYFDLGCASVSLKQQPIFDCFNCKTVSDKAFKETVFDDRMHFSCTRNGKHKCTFDDEGDSDAEERLSGSRLKRKSKRKQCCPQPKSDGDRDKRTLDYFDAGEKKDSKTACPAKKCDVDLPIERIDRRAPDRPSTSTNNFSSVPSTSHCVQTTSPFSYSSDAKAANVAAPSPNRKVSSSTVGVGNSVSNSVKNDNSIFDLNYTSGFHEKYNKCKTSFINFCDSISALNKACQTTVSLSHLLNKTQPMKQFCNKSTQTSDLDYLSPRELKEILACLNSTRVSPNQLTCNNNSNSNNNSKSNNNNNNKCDLNKEQSKSDILLDAILRSTRIKDSDDGETEGEPPKQEEKSNSNVMPARGLHDFSSTNGRPSKREIDASSKDCIDVTCDISESKCDILNEKTSDNKKENYSYIISNKLSEKNFIYIDENKCDSESYVAPIGFIKIKDISNTIDIQKKDITVKSKIKKKLEIDSSGHCRKKNTVNRKGSSIGSRKDVDASNENSQSDEPSCLVDRSENLSSAIATDTKPIPDVSQMLIDRKDLYRNPSALGTKRRIDFLDLHKNDTRADHHESSKCGKIKVNENSLLRLSLSNNCLKTRTETIEADRECELYTISGPHIGSIPSTLDQQKFRKSLDSAASMVFHSRTGLPLTSSPAPIRKGSKCFDYDSNINSVSAIRSALFELAPCTTDDESESDCSAVSPCSPEVNLPFSLPGQLPFNHLKYARPASSLLGTFEESVLNGRLEPVSTVQGFTAEIGASGSFCPSHKVLPVTVFFYTLGDIDKISTPYLGHINLGKKGYNVPKTGTIQVTLLNPLGTVVKMFVVMYDLNDMPPNSQTFIRQRTLYMPTNSPEPSDTAKWGQKYLRYLIHLRFMSSKSGRIYLHTDVRMIIFRKSDMDTATAHGVDMSYELRSFTHYPTNPKFSPRK